MNYYTLTQISLETGVPEKELTELCGMGVFYVTMFCGLVRIDQVEYDKLVNYLVYSGKKNDTEFFQKFQIPY